MKSLVLILALAMMPLASHGAFLCRDIHRPDYLFGLEFTFSNDKIIDEASLGKSSGVFYEKPVKKAEWENWIEVIKQKCAATKLCRLEMSRDKHDIAMKVIFDDGFYFTIGSDSSVLEANARPSTSTQYTGVKQRLKEYLFDTAKKAGLEPQPLTGGGHIHISRKAFEEDTLAFRNLLVDFQNRPELANGAFSTNLANAAPLAALGVHQQMAFDKLTKEFDYKTKNINELINELHSKVFTHGYMKEWGHGNYYQAFNMTRMQKAPESATLEIRSFRPQENAEVYQLQIYLLEAWVNRIKTIKVPIQYEVKVGDYHPPQQIVNAFGSLLRELDLPWDRFSKILPKELRRLRPNFKKKALSYKLNELVDKEPTQAATNP